MFRLVFNEKRNFCGFSFHSPQLAYPVEIVNVANVIIDHILGNVSRMYLDDDKGW